MRILKRILLTLIVLTILMVGSSAAYIYYQQDELEQAVIKEINKRLKSPSKLVILSFLLLKISHLLVLNSTIFLLLMLFKKTLCVKNRVTPAKI